MFCVDLGTTANFAVHNVKRLVFINEVESVYSAVWTESLCNTDTFRLQMVEIFGSCPQKSKLRS